MRAGRKPSFQPGIECLEDRTLMASGLTASLSGGLLRIDGTGRADQVIVRHAHNRISVDHATIRVGGRGRLAVAASGVRRIEVRAKGGNDRVYLDTENRGGRPLRIPVAVWAGAGNDTVRSGQGNDRLHGGTGNDRLDGRGGKDLVDGGAGTDQLRGGAGNDRLHGQGGRDRLDGGSGNDRLAGGAGNDVLLGGAGKDRLDGGAGRNRLAGGPGNDEIVSRSARDRVDGGSGRDRGRFLYASAPRSSSDPDARLIRGIEIFGGSNGGRAANPVAEDLAPPGPLQAHVGRLLALTNSYRAGRGLSRLTVDDRLTSAARYQANTMARTGHYAHVNRDGRTLVDRVRAARYPFAWVAENIHLYDPDIGRTHGIDRHYGPGELADYFFDGWRVSPGHNHNLTASRAEHVGIALARSASGNVYAVQVLGSS